MGCFGGVWVQKSLQSFYTSALLLSNPAMGCPLRASLRTDEGFLSPAPVIYGAIIAVSGLSKAVYGAEYWEHLA